MKVETKIFEIRDAATFIPAMAIRFVVDGNEFDQNQEDWLMRRAGYARHEPYVVFGYATGESMTYDPFKQRSNTMRSSHRHIIENWDELENGDVIDVEYLQGIKTTPKESERNDPF